MKLVTPLALCLCLGRVAAAQTATPLVELRLDPVKQTTHTYRLASISLAVTGAALILTGGLLAGLHNGSDGKLDTGIALTGVGGAALFTSLWVGLNTAGRDAGLRELGAIEGSAPADRLALLDVAERRARHSELVGLGLFVSGLVLFGGGTATAIVGLGNPLESNSSGNTGLFGVGVALSVSGDALWATGAGLLTYHAGKRSALGEGRRTISVLPTGVAGTF
jgi:hypothetical protein